MLRTLQKLVLSLLFAQSAFAERRQVSHDALIVFDDTLKVINENFYDKNFRGLPWAELSAQARLRIQASSSEVELKDSLNQLLAKLKTSHTGFYSDADQDYWGLSSVFSKEIDGAPFGQIGAWFANVEGRWFVKNCFQDSPCQKAGLKTGDEILSVDGMPLEPGRSFQNKKLVQLSVRKSPDSEPVGIEVRPRVEAAQRTMLRASQQSERILSVANKRVGYFHLWSGTHLEFQKSLRRSLPRFEDKSDCLVLDLRDGFGGAGLEYIVDFFDKDFDGKPHKQVFTKPLVAIINGGTRSGKEWITALLKSTGRAHLVGEKTAGYFIGGSPFHIVPGRYLLYLAVQRFDPGGIPEIEGIGIAPHEAVSQALPYSAGHDLQFDAALEACRVRSAG